MKPIKKTTDRRRELPFHLRDIRWGRGHQFAEVAAANAEAVGVAVTAVAVAS